MPELPEVEIVKRSLHKMINSAKITDIKIINKNLRYKIDKDLSKNLINKKILHISRKSKYLIFHLENKILLVHLGMTGKFLLTRTKDKKMLRTSFYYDLDILKKHNHLYFYLNNGLVLIYNDVRKFGFFKLYDIKNLKKIIFLEKLGPDPLSKFFSKKYFINFIKKRKKNIKNLLMDQTFIAGLGNIYVNEVLFLSKIKPIKSCKKLTNKQVKSLIINIKKILKKSIKNGGSSIRDFKSTSGKIGKFQQYFSVYGRENENCLRNNCNGKIKKKFISNRSSFYCQKCQM